MSVKIGKRFICSNHLSLLHTTLVIYVEIIYNDKNALLQKCIELLTNWMKAFKTCVNHVVIICSLMGSWGVTLGLCDFVNIVVIAYNFTW